LYFDRWRKHCVCNKEFEMSKEAMLTAEVAVLMELVHVLSDKVAELEAKQEKGKSFFKFRECEDSQVNQTKQEQGEPVAWVDERSIAWLANHPRGKITTSLEWQKSFERPMPLYTAPQQRKPIDLASAIKYADARWAGVDVPVEWLRHFVDGLGGIKENT
jgi:hypothetical protein